ncbi:hypothetical protein BaRGS_00001387, partial [Batillaria attramentaria]
ISSTKSAQRQCKMQTTAAADEISDDAFMRPADQHSSYETACILFKRTLRATAALRGQRAVTQNSGTFASPASENTCDQSTATVRT